MWQRLRRRWKRARPGVNVRGRNRAAGESVVSQRGKHAGDFFLHFFAGLEFDDSSWRDDDVGAGAIGIPADFGFGLPDLEGTEVAKDDFIAIGEVSGDGVEEVLHDVEDLLLGHAGVIADFYDEIAFGDGLCHSIHLGGGIRVRCLRVLVLDRRPESSELPSYFSKLLQLLVTAVPCLTLQSRGRLGVGRVANPVRVWGLTVLPRPWRCYVKGQFL